MIAIIGRTKLSSSLFLIILTINLVFFLFVFTKSVQSAFNFYISGVEPVQVSSKEDIIDVRIVVNSLPSGDSFFKAGIKNSNSYIGYIKNSDGDWVKIGSLSSDKNNGACKSYFKITSDGEYILKIKIGDDNDLPNGEYVIKAFRFTSSCSSYSDSSETEAFKINVALPIPTPSPTPLPTPAQSFEKPKATLKINDARDQNDSVITGATKIYIDGNYTGNYASTVHTYTFCDDCKCGSNNVPCGFGSHTIKVEKTGYKSWTKTIDVSAGNNYEETPILTISTPTPSPTPKPSATPKTSPTPSLEAENTIQASESVLTLNSSSEPRVLGLESAKINEDKEASGSDSYFNLAAVFFIIAGLSFLSAASYAYFKSKKKKEEKQNENKDSEDQEDF